MISVSSTLSSHNLGINDAMMPCSAIQASFTHTIEVADIDGYLVKIPDAGGKIAREKEEIPIIGQFTYVLEPEGNLLWILQPIR